MTAAVVAALGRAWSWAKRRLTRHARRWMLALPRGLRDGWVLRRVRPGSGTTGDVIVKIADSIEEHEQAARLTYASYVATGLITPRGVAVRVTPFLMLPSTTTFVAVRHGEVIATLSLVQDSALGLPLEEVYGEPVRALRASGRRLAEVGALAVQPGYRGHGLPLLMYKAMWRAAVELLGVDSLVCAVRPEAAIFYSALLRFEPLTRAHPQYPGLHTDSTALHLDLRTAAQTFEQVFARCSPGQFNPADYFLHRTHRQIRLPRRAALTRLQEVHRRAALRLAALRPDMLATLSADTLAALGSTLAAAQLKRPRQHPTGLRPAVATG